MIGETLGLAASVVGTLGYGAYIVSILQGKSKPSRMTWFILSLIAVVVVGTNYDLQASTTLGLLIVNALGSLTILGLSFWYGDGGWEKNDKYALLGLAVSVILWLIIEMPLLGLLFALTFDFWGLYPTIMKVRKRPETEAWFPWSVTVFSNVLNIFALNFYANEALELGVILTPIYFFAINGTVLLFVLVPYLHNNRRS